MKQAPPQRTYDAFGIGGYEADRDSVFVSSSDEKKATAGRARVLQQRGRARMRERVKMAESMLAKAKRLGALAVKSVTRKTLEVYAVSDRELSDWSGMSADSNVEALEVVLLNGFMTIAGTALGARSLRDLKGWMKASPNFSRRPLRLAVWSAVAVGMCRFGGTLAAVTPPGHVRSTSPTGRNAVIQTFKSPRTNGRRGPELGDTISSIQDREEQNWRSGRYDQCRFKTISGDGAQAFSTQQLQDKPMLSLNSADYLLLFRRAAANLQVDMYLIEAATLELQWTGPKSREHWSTHRNAEDGSRPDLYDATKKERTCHPDLVRAHSTGPGTLRALQQPPAVGIA